VHAGGDTVIDTTTPQQPTNRSRINRQDEGSVLILVLVMLMIGSLIVLPLMSYEIAILRANSTLSDKTKRLESVKAGFRIAMAQPDSLYDVCGAGGPTTPVFLPNQEIDGITVSSKCYFIDYQSAQAANELRFGLVATRLGTSVPVSLMGTRYAPVVSSSTTEWLTATSIATETGKIWLPNLPTHALSRRSPGGYVMPVGYPTCTVYFPGTYPDPMTISGPTFFTSGVYYFEKEVKIEGGATVVAGMGSVEGCSTDQEAVFYATDAPTTHNVTGLGATFVFGAAGRLVVTNTNGSNVSLNMNLRYVAPSNSGKDTSAGVAIASVNGEFGVDGVTGQALQVAGAIHVPLSLVGNAVWTDLDGDTVVDPGETTVPVAATTLSYAPSTLTPKPTVPEPPTGVTGLPFQNAAVVSWSAASDGGSPITGYTVTASPGPATCSTTGATSCAITTGVPNGTPRTFSVVAHNANGASLASTPSASVTPGGSALAVPSQPARPTATPYDSAVRIAFTAPSTGGAPITGYTVTSNPGAQTCTIDARVASPTLACDISGLNPLLPYTFTVTATNAVGTSAASLASIAVIPLLGLGSPPVTPPPVPTTYVPRAILDFELSSPTATATVEMSGYVVVPQGRVRVNNPTGDSVRISGGVLAAQFDVVDSRDTGPSTVSIGFIETIVQRKFRIESSNNAGREQSIAVVQINQTGANEVNSWAVQ
jgi:hypothetical protein